MAWQRVGHDWATSVSLSLFILQRLDGLMYLWFPTSNYRNLPSTPENTQREPGLVLPLLGACVFHGAEAGRHPGVNAPFPHLDCCVQDPWVIEAIGMNGPKAMERGWAEGREAAISKAAENRTTVWTSTATSGHVPGESHNSTPMFTEALFTIVRTWKQLKCPTTEGWIKKMWYMYTWNITQS